MHLNPSLISHPATDPQNRKSDIVNRKSIRNIIFDFGGVICNLDYPRCEQAFVRLGFKLNDPQYPASGPKRLSDELEAGRMTPAAFRDQLRPFFHGYVTDVQLDEAWNALLADIPQPRIRLLEAIRNTYRIFMLTNTNEIHYQYYRAELEKVYGYADFDRLFEKAWYSHRIGLTKPDPAIFRFVLADAGLNPTETLFIDDTLVHVEGAHSVGMNAHHLRVDLGREVMELFT